MSNVILRSKTVIGAIIVALGHILHSGEWVEQTDNLIFLTTAMEAVGVVITAYGARKAIAQSANGPMQVKLHWLTMVAAVLTFGLTNMEHTTPAYTHHYKVRQILTAKFAVAEYPPWTADSLICGEKGAPKRPNCADVCGWDATWNYPCSYAVGLESVAGDSLKYIINWRASPDTLGTVDSTFYRIKSNKAFQYYGATGTVPLNTFVRRRKTGAATADSFRLAKPAAGDSAVFAFVDFTQCRKLRCTPPQSGGFKWHTLLPLPQMAPPNIRVETF